MTKSINKEEGEEENTSPHTEVKLVHFEDWEPWTKAREFAGRCRNSNNIKPMSQDDELRLAFTYALMVEAQRGWKFAGSDVRFGIILYRDVEGEVPSLTDMFAADHTKVEEEEE